MGGCAWRQKRAGGCVHHPQRLRVWRVLRAVLMLTAALMTAAAVMVVVLRLWLWLRPLLRLMALSSPHIQLPRLHLCQPLLPLMPLLLLWVPWLVGAAFLEGCWAPG